MRFLFTKKCAKIIWSVLLILIVLSCSEDNLVEEEIVELTTPPPPTYSAQAIDFTDSDPDVREIGGSLSILKAVNEFDLTHYVTYWGLDAITKLPGHPALLVKEKIGDNLAAVIESNTAIPEGAAYFLVFTTNSGIEKSTAVSVKIEDLIVPSSNVAQGVSFLDTDTTPGEIGGNVIITRATDESDVTHYVLYWGTKEAEKLSTTPLAILEKTGSDLSYPLAENTLIPSGVTHLLVFVKNANGEAATAISGIITDSVTPPAVADPAVGNALVPEKTAGGMAFNDADPNKNQISGNLTITPALDESQITHYVVYYAVNESTKLAGREPLVTFAKTGATLTYIFNENTTIPSGATYFLVFTRNTNGEMSKGISILIDDLVLENAAQGLTFTDTDGSSGEIAGTITMTKADDEAKITHYVLYYGSNATTKLSGQAPIVTLAKTGNNLTYTISDNTALPTGATHFLVYTKKDDLEAVSPIAAAIVDVVASNDATLSNLVLSSGTLSPVFSAATLQYSATLGITVSAITLTPTVSKSGAVVKVNTAIVASNSASGNISMSLGSNTITVLVTAPDGITQKTYTLTVTRTMTQEAYLKASQNEGLDYMGMSVAISGDTMVVGAPGEDSATSNADNSFSAAGAAYVFVRSGSTWTQQAYLKASNAKINDNFGMSVAISGDTIVVGASGENSASTAIINGSSAGTGSDGTSVGAAYVFLRNGTTWIQQAYLKAPNAENNDNFGGSVAIAGDTIVVGAAGEDSNETSIIPAGAASANNSTSDSGAAYVFLRSGTTWTQQAYLKSTNTGINHAFGGSVAISGNTIVAGAIGEATFTGAAYVFFRTGTTWTQQARLQASNADTADRFGYSVAVDADTIVVGARDESSNQATIINGTTGSSDNSAFETGAAYVYFRTGTSWSQQAYLKAANGNAHDLFGSSVAISNHLIVISAAREDSSQTGITLGASASPDNTAENSGAAYVFLRDGTTWSQQVYLKAANTGANDSLTYNFPVGVSGNTVVIGIPEEDSSQTTITHGTTASSANNAADAGAAFVFR